MILLLIIVFLPFVFQEMVCPDYQGQLVDPHFPNLDFNDRYLTNNKALFKAYKFQPMIVMLCFENTISVVLEINGHEIPIEVSNRTMNITITDYVKDSDYNTFSIQHIRPSNSKITAYVPYPTLTYGTPESVGMSSILLQKVEDLIKSDINGSSSKGKIYFPGAALIIVKNGKIVLEKAYGYARKAKDGGENMEKFQDLKVNTLFDTASNTKMFATLFSIMKLHSNKRLDYLAQLSKYIPEYRGMDRKGRSRDNITVYDILTHIAGYQPVYEFYNDEVECPTNTKKATEWCLCNKIDFERDRGGEPVYSDLDYILAGLMIEHITGQSLQDYTKDSFYTPLQLNRTTFTPLKYGFRKEDIAATEVIGNTRNHTIYFKGIRTYVLQGEVDDGTAYHSMEEISGHAGLFSTIYEMAILSQVLLNKGGYGNHRFWNKTTQDLFVKPYDLALTYGIGWRRQGNEELRWHFGRYGSNKAIGHTGWTGTVTVIDPTHDLSVILLTNKKHSNFTKGEFEGDTLETGMYGSIMQLIYESFLHV